MKKKKRKIRKGRVVVALTVLAVLVAFIVYFGYLLVRFGIDSIWGDKDNDSKDSITEVDVTPEMEEQSKAMVCVIDSFMAIPQLLDSSNIAISVFDATIQRQIYSYHDHQSLAPASCMKIPTALAAIKRLGLDHRFYESLLVRGEMHGDTLVGSMLLRADDDPMVFALDSLVRIMRGRGIHHLRGDILVSIARKDTLRAHPDAKTWDIPFYKVPLLMRGEAFVKRQLMVDLRRAGVSFRKDIDAFNASYKVKGAMGNGLYHYVAQKSHSLRDILSYMLIHSSNIKAENVFYHLDNRTGCISGRRMDWTATHYVEKWIDETFFADSISDDASAEDKQKYAENMAEKGRIRICDGSGLCPNNRMTASFLVRMLRYAYEDKVLRDYLIDEGLASPADKVRAGSLTTRMWRDEYKGRLFCKTGTLVTIGTSSLAGYLVGRDGHWYIFSIINSNSPIAESRRFQDKLCKAMMK